MRGPAPRQPHIQTVTQRDTMPSDKKILLIEDDPDTASLIREALADHFEVDNLTHVDRTEAAMEQDLGSFDLREVGPGAVWTGEEMMVISEESTVGWEPASGEWRVIAAGITPPLDPGMTVAVDPTLVPLGQPEPTLQLQVVLHRREVIPARDPVPR
jgi:hypothetical protein